MNLLLLLLAALCFASGGLFMKWSNGVTRPAPALTFLGLFALGAVLQAWAMRRADMGIVYVAVLGLEAVLALFLGAVVLHEQLPSQRGIAVVLIIAGVVLLRVL